MSKKKRVDEEVRDMAKWKERMMDGRKGREKKKKERGKMGEKGIEMIKSKSIYFEWNEFFLFESGCEVGWGGFSILDSGYRTITIIVYLNSTQLVSLYKIIILSLYI
ncbi:hypothetical protein V6Z11_D06G184100 [Gossypium hirsutum]